MSRIFIHNTTGQIIAKTPNGPKVYIGGEWREAPDNIPESGFVELAVTQFPLLYAGLERWFCCGGIQLAKEDKCGVCGESY